MIFLPSLSFSQAAYVAKKRVGWRKNEKVNRQSKALKICTFLYRFQLTNKLRGDNRNLYASCEFK